MSKITATGDYLLAHGKPLTTPALASASKCETQFRRSTIATLSQMWASISMQITDYNNIIVISLRMFTLWGPQDQSYLMFQYKDITGKDAIFVADSILPRIFLGPVEYFHQKNVYYSPSGMPTLVSDTHHHSPRAPYAMPLPKLSTGYPNSRNSELSDTGRQNLCNYGQKRPPNSWILYRKSKHAETVLQNPGLPNCKISTLIASMWARETKEVRNSYKALAEQIKYQHALDNPGYRYRPRKSSEVKRRRSKRQIRTSDTCATFALLRQEQLQDNNLSDGCQSNHQEEPVSTQPGLWNEDRTDSPPGQDPDHPMTIPSNDPIMIDFQQYFNDA
ncbi:Mating-type protein a-1 [Golovinomyces cichoracearum]|uniref:Mating-type protein a-1 n=1 Tax=Golovinomyces cichoracearum TaxID=62708 RepID=A0A420HZB7_9PEZI|nr:Mating-type protein a-1 [Golovinomyces cichoracearum]